MGMIITADLIRKFPFAVSPHRVTDDLQILIAVDMERSARAEGHRKALPPVLQTVQQDALMRQAECEASILRMILQGLKTIWQFRTYSKWARPDLERAVAAMVADGRIVQGPKSKANAGYCYSINPDYRAKLEGDAA